MQKTLQNIFLLGTFFIFFVGCSEPEKLEKVVDDEAALVSKVVLDYKVAMVDAVNQGHFNDLEPFLITNSSFYHSLRRYVNELQQEKVKKILVSFEVENVFKGEGKHWFVDAVEVVKLDENGQIRTENRQVQFEVVEDKTGNLRIVTIKKQK